ncbi:MAG: hypothetical protein JO101_04580, partial [Candidatus Eremiobacteraeota bacterium]|nr:hypothetical protein [Candidatus Eremiobacteraeota bacterium]
MFLASGCAGARNASLPPTGQAAHNASATSQGSTRKPLDISAFPTAIDAFPTASGAFPTQSSAYPVCAAGSSAAQCHSQYNANIAPNPNPNLSPSQIPGYHPSDLLNAYGVAAAAATSGVGQNVAVIVAYNNMPSLASDLAVYRATFGLPACTTANGCLQV